MRLRSLAVLLTVIPAMGATAQTVEPVQAAPASFGSLTQNDLSLRVQNDDLEIRFLPLDPAITRLLASDAHRSLRALVEGRRGSIDAVASRAGVTRPGLALVSFYGKRADVRFDPQTITLQLRSRLFQPLGVIPINARFTSNQLNVREQVSAIYLFEEDLPVDDSFSVSYGTLLSEDWRTKQGLIDRERARVSARSRAERPDTTKR